MTTQKTHIKILTPAYSGSLTTHYFHSTLEFVNKAQKEGITVSVDTATHFSLISLGRNMMQSDALARDKTWTHILWIDGDIGYHWSYPFKLLDADKPIIGGFYPKKEFPIGMASSADPRMEMTDTYCETDYVATGFMLIKREVVEKMEEFYRHRAFHYGEQQGPYYDLYSPYIDETGLYLSEDYAFFRLARRMGIKSYMSKEFSLQHFGNTVFSGDAEDVMLKKYEERGYVTIKSLYPHLDDQKESN